MNNHPGEVNVFIVTGMVLCSLRKPKRLIKHTLVVNDESLLPPVIYCLFLKSHIFPVSSTFQHIYCDSINWRWSLGKYDYRPKLLLHLRQHHVWWAVKQKVKKLIEYPRVCKCSEMYSLDCAVICLWLSLIPLSPKLLHWLPSSLQLLVGT